MTIEAIITRKFGINFIDARTLVTESRLNLKILGYPNEEEERLLIDEASRLFAQHPEETRQRMQAQRISLESCTKTSNGSAQSETSSVADVEGYYCNNDDASSFADGGSYYGPTALSPPPPSAIKRRRSTGTLKKKRRGMRMGRIWSNRNDACLYVGFVFFLILGDEKGIDRLSFVETGDQIFGRKFRYTDDNDHCWLTSQLGYVRLCHCVN